MSASLCELDMLMDPMEAFANTLLMLKNSGPSVETKRKARDALSSYQLEIVCHVPTDDSESDSQHSRKRARTDKNNGSDCDSVSSPTASAAPSPSNREASPSRVSTFTSDPAEAAVSKSTSDDHQQLAKKNLRGKYRCGRCGMPKTNHVCSVESKFMVQYCAATQCEAGDASLASFSSFKTLTVRPRATIQVEAGN